MWKEGFFDKLKEVWFASFNGFDFHPIRATQTKNRKLRM
jgi:hypothetical protein